MNDEPKKTTLDDTDQELVKLLVSLFAAVCTWPVDAIISLTSFQGLDPVKVLSALEELARQGRLMKICSVVYRAAYGVETTDSLLKASEAHFASAHKRAEDAEKRAEDAEKRAEAAEKKIADFRKAAGAVFGASVSSFF